MTAAVVAKSRVGRPKDPDVTRRALVAGRAILATQGLDGFTMDAVAVAAGVGKASIYRRWPSKEAVLADVVCTLGVRPVNHGPGPGTLYLDISRVLHAATSGRDARAELTVLSGVARSTDLRTAYLAGPLTRLITALNIAEVRGRHRGEPAWPHMGGPLAGFRLLQHAHVVEGVEPSMVEVGAVVQQVVMPALGRAS